MASTQRSGFRDIWAGTNRCGRSLIKRFWSPKKYTREELILVLGEALYAEAARIGPKVVQQVLRESKRAGIPSKYIPFVFWALSDQSTWPEMSKPNKDALSFAWHLMNATGNTPKPSSMAVPTNPDGLRSPDAVFVQVSKWAFSTMTPDLAQGYLDSLVSLAKHVPAATENKIGEADGADWLHESFTRIRASFFPNGRLLKRILRHFPF